MANNDKLNQIISNIKILNDLAYSMIDAEMFPVSFFSQAFDLLQEMQKDFHALETEQVDLFDQQMKKHQALILSIHKQMRNIDIPQTPKAPEDIPKVEKDNPLFDTDQTIIVTEVCSVQTNVSDTQPVSQETTSQQENTSPKGTLLNRLGFYKEDNAVPSQKNMPPTKPNNVPDWPTTQSQHQPQTLTETHKASVNGISTESSAPPCVNDMIEKNKISDLRKAFSLNDRFRYRRELFGGSETVMNKAIASLNEISTLHDAVQFLEERLHWDFSHPTVKDFIKILEMRYL